MNYNFRKITVVPLQTYWQYLRKFDLVHWRSFSTYLSRTKFSVWEFYDPSTSTLFRNHKHYQT